MRHATVQELEEYVSGRGAGWLDDHCEACASCAAALAAEARLEVALRSMAAERRCGLRADAVVAPLTPPRPAPLRTSFVALAAAACVAFAVAAVRLPPAVVQPAPDVRYADAGGTLLVQPEALIVTGAPSGGTP